MYPTAAVQILSYGNSETECRVFDALRESLTHVTYPKDLWQIVIVDNPSSRGNLRQYLAERWASESERTLPRVTVIARDENNGFAGGHMTAFEYTKTLGVDFVFLLNQDAVVDPEFLTRSVAFAVSHPKAAVFQSRIMLEQDRERLNSEGNAFHFLGFSFSIGSRKTYRPNRVRELPLFCASGAAVMIRMDCLARIGLFDSAYFLYHEDVDLSWRARLAGYDIAYVEDSVVYHHYEFLRSISKVYLMERNRHLTNFVNYEWKTLAFLLPMALIMEIGTFIFAIKSGWGMQKLRSWAFFFRPTTWRMIVKKRKEIARIRTVSDAALFPFMCSVIVNQDIQNPLLTFIVNPMMTAYFWGMRKVLK
jgi:GT2 family glycosyltransferase